MQLYRHRFLFLALVFSSITIPFAILLYNINSYSVDVPFYDEWLFMGHLLDRLDDSRLTWSEIVAPHNEHRIASTVLTYALTLSFGTWNRICAANLNAFTALASFLVFLAAFFPLAKKIGIPFFVVLVLTAAALFFSAQAFENWSWGFQIQWFQLNLLE